VRAGAGVIFRAPGGRRRHVCGRGRRPGSCGSMCCRRQTCATWRSARTRWSTRPCARSPTTRRAARAAHARSSCAAVALACSCPYSPCLCARLCEGARSADCVRAARHALCISWELRMQARYGRHAGDPREAGAGEEGGQGAGQGQGGAGGHGPGGDRGLRARRRRRRRRRAPGAWRHPGAAAAPSHASCLPRGRACSWPALRSRWPVKRGCVSAELGVCCDQRERACCSGVPAPLAWSCTSVRSTRLRQTAALQPTPARRD